MHQAIQNVIFMSKCGGALGHKMFHFQATELLRLTELGESVAQTSGSKWCTFSAANSKRIRPPCSFRHLGFDLSIILPSPPCVVLNMNLPKDTLGRHYPPPSPPPPAKARHHYHETPSLPRALTALPDKAHGGQLQKQ